MNQEIDMQLQIHPCKLDDHWVRQGLTVLIPLCSESQLKLMLTP